MKTYLPVVFLLLGLAAPAYGQLTITTTSLPDGMVTRVYSATLTATGSTGTLTWTVDPSSALPAGLSLSSSGAITGTPTSNGTISVKFNLADSVTSATKTISMVIRANLVIATNTLTSATVGSTYNSGALSATGGSGTNTWNITGLPSPLVFSSSTGAITGTPSSVGSSPYALNVSVQDSSTPPFTTSKNLTLTINTGLAISTASIPNGTVSQSYSQTLAGTGGTGTGYTWTLAPSSGALPTGLTLSTGGVISGTPTIAGGPTNVTVRLTDSSAAFVDKAFSLTINSALVINTVSLANGSVGSAYSQNLVATGGSGSYTYSVSVGSLPSGLSLNSSSGLISGTPSAGGASTFTILVTDSLSGTVTKQFTITVTAPLAVTTASLAAGGVGSAYSQTLAASGGTTTGYTWLITSGALPGGLTLNTSTGAITGTPTTTTGSPFTFTAQVTDSGSATATKSLSITIHPTLAVSTSSLPAGAVGSAYNQTLAATGGSGSGYTWSVVTGALPGGLTLNTSTGAITGTPSTATGSPFSFTVQVVDSASLAATKALSITIGSSLTVSTSSLAAGEVGASYSQTLTATGGTGSGYTWSIASGALPGGLTLNTSTGAITGTPNTTTGSPFAFIVQVQDSASSVATKSLSITINSAISISTVSLPAGTVGTAYNQTLATTGGSGSGLSWTVSSGALPGGLSLGLSTGAITGTPTTTTGSPFNFTVQVTDSLGGIATKAMSITINAAGSALAISTSTPLLNATVNQAYSQTLTATGGTGTGYTWTVTGGGLPTGLSLSTGGVVSGTPTVVGGPTSFTARVTDSSTAFVEKAFSITVNSALVINTSSPLATGAVSTSYSQTLVATGGTGSGYTFTISAGSLPTGLSLSTGGVISGTPTAGGAFNFTVQVTDSQSNVATKAFAITITGGTLTITTSSLPSWTINTNYSQTLSATGGVLPYTWAIASGSLPTGLSIAANTGTISGLPTVASNFTFTVQVSDGSSFATQQYTVSINPSMLLLTASVPNGVVSTSYSTQLAVSGGTAPFVWTISQGALPGGLSLNSSTGVISGTPTTTVTGQSFTVQVVDAASTAALKQLSMSVTSTGLSVTTSSIPNPVLNSAYSVTLAATGGSGTGYTWTVPAGNTLPTGLSLTTGGVLQGTPTAAGTFSFNVQVTDSVSNVASRGYTVTVTTSSLTISNATPLNEALVGNVYTTALIGTGGSGTGYTFSISAGVLPGGLSMNSAGVISGTPNAAGVGSFTVQLVDSLGTVATKTFTLAVANSVLLITSGSPLPDANVGTAYAVSIGATGGVGSSYVFTTTSLLPNGITLSPNGTLQGTPTQAGTFVINVQVVDGVGGVATKPLSLTVTQNVLTITTTGLPAAATGAAYSTSLNASGGITPYTWSIQTGLLPTGITLSSSGLLSGTPTVAGTYNFTVRVRDANNLTADANLSLLVVTFAITTQSLPDATIGTSYNQTLSAVGGTLPYTWSLATGSSLPAGLSLTAAGVISGTPTATGRTNFTVTVRDSTNNTATMPLSILVGSTLTISTAALPAGVTGTAYDQTLVAGGGTAPYTWAVISGALPVGLTLNGSTGRISGTPATTIGSPFNFTVQVTDSASITASKPFTIAITTGAGALSITTAATLPNAAPSTNYTQALAATGGTTPYTWAITSGLLPNGMTLSSGGVITGTTTQSGTFQFTARVSDSSSPTQTDSRVFTLMVAQSSALTISTASLANGSVGVAYAATTLVSTGGTQTGLTWSLTQGTLPPGLGLSTAGVLSGTPTSAGTFTFTVQVSDSAAAVATKQFTITITAGGLTITTQTLPNGAVGTPYTATTLTATGGTGIYNWVVLSGAPPGMSLTTAGVLTGTPTAGGTYSLFVQVTDSANVNIFKSLQLIITGGGALTITTPSLPNGLLSTAYTTTTLQATGGTAPYTWSILSGLLPTGLTFNNGVIAGTPTASGTFQVTVRVTDAASTSAQITYTITITAGSLLTITTPASITPGATLNVPYTTTLSASGGLAPYQWIVTAGVPPIGLTLTSNTGALSGTPVAPGTYQFTARVADSSNPQQTASQTFTLVVSSGTLSITTNALTNAVTGQSYNFNLTASGAVGALTWSVSSGQLPAGIGLNTSSGLLTGIPTVTGTFPFTVQVVDAGNNATTSKQFSIVVGTPLSITTTALAGGTVNTAYTQTLTASGGTGTGYSWVLLSGSLPPGLTLTPSTGAITGTPSQTGTFNFTVQVSDSSGGNVSKQLSITIGTTLSITTVALPVASTGTAYSQALSASGGTPPLTWSVTSVSALPPGLVLGASNGVITGSATTPGTYTFTVRVQDATGTAVTKDLSIVVVEGLSIVTPTALPDASENAAYTQTLRASGGSAPYIWNVSVGSLPAGLNLSSGGVISGTPTTAGSYSFIVQVADAQQQTAQKAFTLVVGGRVTITIQSLPNATARAFYFQNLTASGGTPPYTWSLSGGNPPIGLTIDSSGVLSGTPSNAGVFTFTVQVTDAVNGTATRTFTLSVVQGLNITTSSPLPAGVAGAAYAQVLTASGGTPPYSWTSSGTLPPGLTLSQGGVLSGTPTASGSYNFQLQVSDSAGSNASGAFSLSVGLPSRPTLNINGVTETILAAQQPRITLSLGSSYPLDITGTLTMTFTPDAAVPVDDPAVVFTNGARTVNFTIPANQTNAQLPNGFSMQSGTVAGTITMTVSLRSGGQDVTPSPAPTISAKLNRDVPVIRALRATRVTGGLQVEITGYSTPREVTSATFRFTPAPGSTLQTTEITVQLGDGARSWYQNEASRVFGSQFTLTQQFNVQGDTSAISSVTVTLTNAQGNSQASNATFQ